jgi:hypothetical protein
VTGVAPRHCGRSGTPFVGAGTHGMTDLLPPRYRFDPTRHFPNGAPCCPLSYRRDRQTGVRNGRGTTQRDPDAVPKLWKQGLGYPPAPGDNIGSCALRPGCSGRACPCRESEPFEPRMGATAPLPPMARLASPRRIGIRRRLLGGHCGPARCSQLPNARDGCAARGQTQRWPSWTPCQGSGPPASADSTSELRGPWLPPRKVLRCGLLLLGGGLGGRPRSAACGQGAASGHPDDP